MNQKLIQNNHDTETHLNTHEIAYLLLDTIPNNATLTMWKNHNAIPMNLSVIHAVMQPLQYIYQGIYVSHPHEQAILRISRIGGLSLKMSGFYDRDWMHMPRGTSCLVNACEKTGFFQCMDIILASLGKLLSESNISSLALDIAEKYGVWSSFHSRYPLPSPFVPTIFVTLVCQCNC